MAAFFLQAVASQGAITVPASGNAALDSVSPVPEPASLLMAGLGLGILVVLQRARKG